MRRWTDALGRLRGRERNGSAATPNRQGPSGIPQRPVTGEADGSEPVLVVDEAVGVRLIRSAQEAAPETGGLSWRALRGDPGTITLLFGPAAAATPVLWPRLGDVLDSLSAARVRNVRLTLTGAAAQPPGHPALAQRIADAWELDVTAADGAVIVVPDGSLFTRGDGPGPHDGWRRFSPGVDPLPLGPRDPAPSWQGAFSRLPRYIDEDCAVDDIPAGVLVRYRQDPEQRPGDLSYAVLPDKRRPLVLVGASRGRDVPAQAVAALLATLPADARAEVCIASGGQQDVLPVAQEVSDMLGAEIDVLTGLPLLTDGGEAYSDTGFTVPGGPGAPVVRPSVETVRCRPAPAAAPRAPFPPRPAGEGTGQGGRASEEAAGTRHLENGDGEEREQAPALRPTSGLPVRPVPVPSRASLSSPTPLRSVETSARRTAAPDIAPDALGVPAGGSVTESGPVASAHPPAGPATLREAVAEAVPEPTGTVTVPASVPAPPAAAGQTLAAERAERASAAGAPSPQGRESAAQQSAVPPRAPGTVAAPEPAGVQGRTSTLAPARLPERSPTPVPGQVPPYVLRPPTEEDRAAFRELVGAVWSRHAAAVARALVHMPALRGTGQEEAICDLLAVQVYLTAPEQDPLSSHTLDHALRTGDTALRPYAVCLAAGLRRLPAHRGAAVRGRSAARVKTPPTAAPDTLLYESAPLGALALSAGRRTMPDTGYAIWSLTGRRVRSLLGAAGSAASADPILFPPGTAFEVLETRTGEGGSGSPLVLLRELPGPVTERAEQGTGLPRAEDAGRTALTRLGQALNHAGGARPSGEGRQAGDHGWPRHCAGPFGAGLAPGPVTGRSES
ncbi:hypothetical protein ACFYWY_36935 [Streptomyces sp. NPDC002870]|uniref:hypothetical protein n=1 Tax=Streptomyces sp. NPDC002870 TaxID=3364666 RepID=UPI0036B5D537